MGSNMAEQDYFWLQGQYGTSNKDTTTATADKGKETPSIKTIDQKKILVKDDKGVATSVPSIKYVEQLEKQVEQLEETNRTLKAQVQTAQRNVITLDGRIQKMEQLLNHLTNHGNF